MYNIVLVDDEEWGLTSLESSLCWDEYGFRIAAGTTNPLKALEKIREVKPEAVFVDIRMPGMGGMELIDQARKEGCNSRFIIVSGYADFQYAKEAIGRGVYDYLLKPVDPHKMQMFLEKLKETLDRDRYHRSTELMHDTAKLIQTVKESGRYQDTAVLSLMAVRMTEQRQKREAALSLEKYEKGLVLGEEQLEMFLVMESKEEEMTEWPNLAAGLARLGCYVGVSTPFVLGSGIANAVVEAREAAAGQFLGLRPCIRFFRPSCQLYFRQDSARLRMAVSSGKSTEINKILGEIRKKLMEGELGFDSLEFVIQDIRNVMMKKHNLALLGGREMESPEKILKNFRTVRSLFETLEKGLEEQLAENGKKAAIVCENEHFRKLLTYVEEHYGEQLQLKKLSEMFYLNMTYCSELFKKVTGKNFSEYLTELRMEAAMEMLLTGGASVGEVAEKTGFGDSYYFSKVFKKYFGISPNSI